MDKEILASELQKVYNEPVELWGPYPCKDGRKRIDVFLKNTEKSKTNLFARVLLEASLGRKLSGNETVDHVDGNKENDSLDNLQILTRQDNARKSANPTHILEWVKVNQANGTLGAYYEGEKNGQAKLSDKEVRDIREGFSEFSDLNSLLNSVPLNRKSLRSLLQGKTYPTAGGPLLSFIPRKHNDFIYKD